MKPFDIELAKQGHPVCTRDGKDVKIIRFERNPAGLCIVAEIKGAIPEMVTNYTQQGKYYKGDTEHPNDLFMKFEKHTGYACFQPLWDGRTYRVPIAAEICETPHCAKLTSKNPNDIVVKLEWEE